MFTVRVTLNDGRTFTESYQDVETARMHAISIAQNGYFQNFQKGDAQGVLLKAIPPCHIAHVDVSK